MTAPPSPRVGPGSVAVAAPQSPGVAVVLNPQMVAVADPGRAWVPSVAQRLTVTAAAAASDPVPTIPAVARSRTSRPPTRRDGVVRITFSSRVRPSWRVIDELHVVAAGRERRRARRRPAL